MLIPYDQLKQSLSAEALTNLMREFLLQQITDQGFDQTDDRVLAEALPRVEAALRRGELVVEYSEEEESVAIRPADQVACGLPA
ncbi:YheU family protein [Ferrimonas sediminicola]|uniref:YheU family protein n=1 Tax=Ferrimonas sediminicola TaxID=2569538 RepID=A0A4U1BCU9_9GAMM|nr:YheU family protein [Ferrimonas sediminicola]TKB48045.1 YheU family protein [Ferrimonas sediminicola]